MRDVGQGEDQLLGDGMACGLNGNENLFAAIGIKFVPIKSKEEAFSDSFRGGLWVLFPYGRFNESTRCLAHRTGALVQAIRVDQPCLGPAPS